MFNYQYEQWDELLAGSKTKHLCTITAARNRINQKITFAKKNMKQLMNNAGLPTFPLKFELRGKLTAFFLLVCMLQAGATTYPQKARVSLEMNNVALSEVFNRIETLSEFRFFIDTKKIDVNRKVSITAKNEKIADILDRLFKDTGITYEVYNRQILLKKREITPAPAQIMQSNIRVEETQYTITGTVVDEIGTPLSGANILEKGTSNGTQTGSDGKFAISVKDENAILTISFVGYLSQDISVGKQKTIQIVLKASNAALDGVVVVGYGTSSKKKITGSVSQLKSDDLTKYGSGSSFTQSLAGRASGVLINERDGQPGSAQTIQIRGVGTLTAGVQPLIVVDGLPLTEGTTLNSINPNDIESLDILKDPASASIYGSRAANGVIMITTKKAKTDKTTINFDYYTGWQRRADNFEKADTYDAARIITEARDNAYVAKTGGSITDDRATRLAKGAGLRDLRLDYLEPYLAGEQGLVNTNWQDIMFSTAPMSNYNLSGSGRMNAKSDYYVGLNYMTQDGILRGNKYDTYRGTFKINSQVGNKLTFGVTVMPTVVKQKYANLMDALQGMFPFVPAYNPDGTYAISEQYKMNAPGDANLHESALAQTDLINRNRQSFRTMGNGFLEYSIIPGLKFRSTLGGDYFTQNQNEFNPSNIGAYRTPAPKPATANHVTTNFWNYITENTLNWKRSFSEHDVEVLGGYSFQKESGYSININGTNIPDNNIRNISAASSFAVSHNRYDWAQISWYARLKYEFADKYLLTASFRRDGSSRFGSGNKWGNFPSVSAGWIVSSEPFMSGTANWLTFLKIRGSVGLSGNSQISNYGALSLLSPSNYLSGNSLLPGYYASTAPNPNLGWETQLSKNLGLDATLFNNLSVGVSYYNNTTKDLLLNVPVPQQSGYSSMLRNIGKIRNQGVEVEMTWNNIKIGQTRWSVGGNISSNKNEVLALADGQTQIISGNFVTRVGGPIAEFFGYKAIGIYKSAEDFVKYPNANSRLGDVIYEDTNKDGKLDNNDRQLMGKTYAPDFFYGISLNMNWKNLDFSVNMTGLEGRTVYDEAMTNNENGEIFTTPNSYYAKNYWHPVNNPGGFLPAPTTSMSASRALTAKASSMLFYSADYFRIRRVQVGYNVRSNALDRIRVTKLRIYMAADNPFTFTGYRGYNPESTTTDILTAGNISAGNQYPIARNLIIGLNVQF